MWTGEVRIEDRKYSVYAQITRCGADVSLTVGGGESPHLGAAALSVPRPSMRDPEKLSASTSVICVPGHKEDDFARRAAERIASELGCVASVCAGVHVDDAEPEELARLSKNLDALLDAVIAALQ